MSFKERYIHLIWKHSFYNSEKLFTTSGEKIHILFSGYFNIHSGPDFREAKIKINDITMFGDIEIHNKSSDWYKHNHHKDKGYNNVILHVVNIYDKITINLSGNIVPTFVIKDYITTKTINHVKLLLDFNAKVLCMNLFKNIYVNYDVLVKERIQKKINFILYLLHQNINDWEETCYQFLCYNFGFNVNNVCMLQLSRSIKYKIIKKNKHNIFSLTALFFGQGQLLDRIKEENKNALLQEYIFLKNKYNLSSPNINWHFLRLRPNNFPTKRLQQIITLFYSTDDIITNILNNNYEKVKIQLRGIKPRFSVQSIDSFFINIFIPLHSAYRQYSLNDNSTIACYLKTIKPENNNIVRYMTLLKPQNAFESQAIIELYDTYCLYRKCLFCPVRGYINISSSV